MASAKDRTAGVLTPLELQIMQVLWDGGAATVGEVQSRLAGELAYTTVQTMLGVLLRKKKVRRDLAGRAYVYRPAISREGAVASALSDLVGRMFGGSAEALLMSLVDTRQITAEEIARAAALLEKEKG
ncbi:MAG TPA: BlaI/MecI/CopY family transcriptional regulator [Caulobacteraceae bacterium]|jgi:predicted transcriptional regulator|nr:BlaI/MecI/CopY family transcriptional regulator [Caulobacteraceae bacterium]